MSKSALQFVLAIVALLVPVDLTMAGDRPTDAQCRNFATFAVQNAQKVRSLYCTTLPWNNSSLSLDWKKQYNFCMSVRTETVEVRMEVLVAQSDKCYYCRRFEDAVLALMAIARDRQCEMKTFSRHPDRWEHSSKPESQRAHAMCMASEKVIGDSHHYDACDSVKPQLDAILADMAYELESCEWRRTTREQATFQLSVVPKCAACHDSKRTTATSPAALQSPPKRGGGDPTIARQPPAFTPTSTEGERRRTPRDTSRGTSSGDSDQVKRGAPAGGSGSAMDRLGGGGTLGTPSGGGGSGGGSAGRPAGASGGGASGGAPSANNPAPNINSNTIMKQAPAFGQTPGLR